MYKRIVLAVDLAEPTQDPKGLEQALELAKMGDSLLRLVNVQPVVPATFMEYVPVDFDRSRRSGRRTRSTPFSPASICRRSGKAQRRGRAGSITSSCRRRPNGAPTSSWSARTVPSCRTICSARTPRRSCAMRSARCWSSGNDGPRGRGSLELKARGLGFTPRAPASPLRRRRASAGTCDAGKFRRSSSSTANGASDRAASD